MEDKMQVTVTIPNSDVKKIKKMKETDMQYFILVRAIGEKVFNIIKEKK